MHSTADKIWSLCIKIESEGLIKLNLKNSAHVCIDSDMKPRSGEKWLYIWLLEAGHIEQLDYGPAFWVGYDSLKAVQSKEFRCMYSTWTV